MMATRRQTLWLGVDVGGTSTRVAVARSPRGPLRRRSISTPTTVEPVELADHIVEMARSLTEEAGGDLVAAGIAFAGPVDVRRGRIVEAPNLPRFQDVPFREMMAERLNVLVALENDANAAALAEHRLGAGRGRREMVYLTISTGIGGGIISQGRLYGGAVGGAGEAGHMTIAAGGARCGCGRDGCLEALASGTAIAREAATRLRAGEASLLRDILQGNLKRLSAREVFEAAQRGDALSLAVLEHASTYLGIGLANLVNLLNPELVVLGGGLTREAEGLFVAPAIRVARARAQRLHAESVEFAVTRLGDDIGLRGALLLASGASTRRRAAALAGEPTDDD